MDKQTSAENQLAALMVEVLNLEELAAEDIAPEEMLFGEGLGLDSIDALELSLAVSKEYGVHLKSEDKGIREAFSSLRSLSAYIQENLPS